MDTLTVYDIPTLQAELARRNHLDFMRFMWQKSEGLVVGRHITAVCNLIDQAIDDYRQGKSSFLVVKIPFRHGKSSIVSQYLPANFIGKFPDEEVIVAGYAYSLVRGFSRFSRAILQDKRYRYVYPDVMLSKDLRAVDQWGIEGKHGLVHWLGIGGSITGKGGSCFPAGTMIKTDRGNVDISLLYQLYSNYKVLTYSEQGLEYNEIRAVSRRVSENLFELVTDTGRTIRATNDHLFYVSGQWIPVEEIKPEENVTVCNNEMYILWKDILERIVFTKKGRKEKLQGFLLLEREKYGNKYKDPM